MVLFKTKFAYLVTILFVSYDWNIAGNIMGIHFLE